MDLLYSILISPIEHFFILILSYAISITHNIIVSLLLLSIAFNVLLIPFYILSDLFQRKDKAVRVKMDSKLQEFAFAFSGYEKHLYLKELYRRHQYKSWYSLISALPLLVQVPVFIAAYIALSHFNYSDPAGFLNYAQADGLLYGINVIPIMMFIVNLLSVYFYRSLLTNNQAINAVIVGFLFLILLYEAASGLVIYWLFNNMVVMLKNYYLYQLKGGNKDD